jgi:nucleoside-diphosphate-sugar epimerase
MPRTLFITGIGGFIGARLAELARERGFVVRGLDSSEAAVQRARARGADVSVGSITDQARLEGALAGADAVVNTAAIVRESGPLEEFRRVNVQGARSVALAAREAGAKTFVQLSSVMVYGFQFPDRVSEDGPLRGEGSPYCQTKIESEAAVLPLDDAERFRVIVVRPGDVYGAGSVPWVLRPVDMMRRGRFFLPNRGRGIMNHVYVDNLVDAVLLAIEKAEGGQAFNVTDGLATTFSDYFARLATAAQLPPPRSLPTPLLYAVAGGYSLARKLGVTDDPTSTDSVKYLLRPHAYSNEKVRRELGWQPRIDLDEGMRRVAVSLQQPDSSW